MLAYSIRCNLEDLENRKADIEAEIKMVQLRHEIEWLEKALKAMEAIEWLDKVLNDMEAEEEDK